MKKLFLVLLALSSGSMAFAKEGNPGFEARMDRRKAAAAQDAQAAIALQAVEVSKVPAPTSDGCGTCC